MRHLILFLLLAALIALNPAFAADKTTRHTLALPEGPLALTATVETQKLTTPDGKPAAEIVTTAFTADGPARPVTFSLGHALLQAHGTAKTGGDIALWGDLTLPDLTPLAAIGGVALQGVGE